MGLVVDLAGQHPKLPPENWVIVQSRVWLTDCQSLLKGKEWTPTRAPAISLLVKLAGALHHYPPTPENIDNSSQCQYPKERCHLLALSTWDHQKTRSSAKHNENFLMGEKKTRTQFVALKKPKKAQRLKLKNYSAWKVHWEFENWSTSSGYKLAPLLAAQRQNCPYMIDLK